MGYGADVGRAHAVSAAFKSGKIAGAQERDKWWIEQIEELFSPKNNWSDNAFDRWELLKQSIIMDKSMREAADGKLIDRGSFAKYAKEE